MKYTKPSAAAHVIVLAGPLLALLYTLVALTGGNGVRFISAAWLLAVFWTFVTALSAANATECDPYPGIFPRLFVAASGLPSSRPILSNINPSARNFFSGFPAPC